MVCEVDVVVVKYTVMDWLRFAGLGFSDEVGINWWKFILNIMPFCFAYILCGMVGCIYCLLMHMLDTDTTWIR